MRLCWAHWVFQSPCSKSVLALRLCQCQPGMEPPQGSLWGIHHQRIASPLASPGLIWCHWWPPKGRESFSLEYLEYYHEPNKPPNEPIRPCKPLEPLHGLQEPHNEPLFSSKTTGTTSGCPPKFFWSRFRKVLTTCSHSCTQAIQCFHLMLLHNILEGDFYKAVDRSPWVKRSVFSTLGSVWHQSEGLSLIWSLRAQTFDCEHRSPTQLCVKVMYTSKHQYWYSWLLKWPCCIMSILTCDSINQCNVATT